MSDHFSLDCHPAELTAAETKLGLLSEHLQHEGGRLATLRGDSSGWTGAAATACLGEAVTISTTMTTQGSKIQGAVNAVKTFRIALETAQAATLPRLNSRWEQSETDYNTKVGKAGSTYANELHGYRNVPDEDAGPARAAAVGVRNRALGDASVQQAGAQEGINGDYDEMIRSLEQAAKACGAALAGAVPITFTAEQWAKVKGGHIPIGMLASLRSQVFDEDSFVRQSDGVTAGEFVAGKLDDQATNAEPGERLDPEVVALMGQMKGDEAFAQTLMTDLGPGGAAFLSMRARSLYESPSEGEDRTQGKELLGILTDLFATGSNVRVPAGNGQSRPLMDKEWLDNFNPESYDKAGERYEGRFDMSTYVHGYRPDLLLPFMSKTGGFSSDFSQLVSQRALEDYEKGKDLEDQDAMERWGLYRGDDDPFQSATAMRAVLVGDSGNPFRTELLHIALDRAAEHPFASNALMMTHRDTMLELMTGKEDWLTGGDNRHDWASPALASILEQATVGSQASTMVSADAALWGVGDYLKNHPDEHMVENVQVALGDVVTDKRFMNGAMSSVTSPFGSDAGFDGFRDDPTHPQMGPLMNEKLWAALHQEAMRQPETAAKIIAETKVYINDWREDTNELRYTWDQSADDGKGLWVKDTDLTLLDRYQSEAARHFLGTNLKAASAATMAELERELAEHGKDKEQAKVILGTMVGWATDPASITGDVVGKLTGFAVDSAVEWAMPEGTIRKSYDEQIAAQNKMLADPVFSPDYWETTRESSNLLINDILDDNVQTEVQARQRGLDHPEDAPPRTYDGDPRSYIGHVSDSSGYGPPQTDDFLEYGQDGAPTGVKLFREMNAPQRVAYMNWMHDPAVQKYCGTDASADTVARAELDE